MAIVGIAGVVIVFVAVLSMAQGFFNAMHSAGAPDRALVMRTGADDEMTSGLSGPQTDIVKQAPGIFRDGQRAIASAELFVIIDLPKRSTHTAANVPMRGIEPTTFEVRREARIVEGRMLTFGTNEIVAGRAASRSVRRLERRLGREGRSVHLDGRRDLRVGRERGRDRAVVRRPRPPGRVPTAATAISRCSHGWTQ